MYLEQEQWSKESYTRCFCVDAGSWDWLRLPAIIAAPCLSCKQLQSSDWSLTMKTATNMGDLQGYSTARHLLPELALDHVKVHQHKSYQHVPRRGECKIDLSWLLRCQVCLHWNANDIKLSSALLPLLVSLVLLLETLVGKSSNTSIHSPVTFLKTKTHEYHVFWKDPCIEKDMLWSYIIKDQNSAHLTIAYTALDTSNALRYISSECCRAWRWFLSCPEISKESRSRRITPSALGSRCIMMKNE